jgi:YidC/Oxa1 family membrane protein insertase
MAKMKKVQPKIKEIQERYKDDKQELQKQTMALYQKEKINPVAGCLPMLLQIPVFYSLYIVLYMTIEMRHAPFFGWIRDLSARDPTSLFNLFGLLPYHVPNMLMIGAWPVVYCITMMIQMRLNPTAMDPTQKMVMTWMPVFFTFMLASFPVGLVIYWTCSNVLMIGQQTLIMRRMGTPVEFSRVLALDSIGKLMGNGKRADKKTGA